MRATDKLLIWDFEGTLGVRQRGWTALLVEILDEHEAGHGVTLEQLRPHLARGFPWHEPERPHPELCEPDRWWERVCSVLAGALEAVGIEPGRAAELARHARTRYIDPTRGWMLFSDTIPVLRALASRGWTHAVLSNHVPELVRIVDGLGIGPLVSSVTCSAVTGYEKPHPQAYAEVERLYGRPASVWMIGDSYDADVAGAERVGIRAILVRKADARSPRFARDLSSVLMYVEPP